MPRAISSNIGVEEFRAEFNYNPDTGVLTRKSTDNRLRGLTLRFMGENHETSRYIWMHFYGEWPPLDMLVDHRDRDRYNWKISNLRLATYSQNGCNMIRLSTIGIPGIAFDASRQKCWRAQIRIDGKKVNLGRFHTLEEAVEVHKKASKEFHKEFSPL